MWKFLDFPINQKQNFELPRILLVIYYQSYKRHRIKEKIIFGNTDDVVHARSYVNSLLEKQSTSELDKDKEMQKQPPVPNTKTRKPVFNQI